MKCWKGKKSPLYFLFLKVLIVHVNVSLVSFGRLGASRHTPAPTQFSRQPSAWSATIRGDPRRSAAIRSDPAASEPPFGVRWGYARNQKALRRRSCASEPIRTDPPQPTPTDPNQPQLTSCVPSGPPPPLLVRPGFQCSGCSFFFRDLTSQERAKRWQRGGEYNIAIFLSRTFVRLRFRCTLPGHVGRTVLPKWSILTHLFYSVFYSVSVLGSACFQAVPPPGALFHAETFSLHPCAPKSHHIRGFSDWGVFNSSVVCLKLGTLVFSFCFRLTLFGS